MIIRKATDKDIPGIMTLLRQVNDVHADGRPDIFIHGKTKYLPADLISIIKDPNSPVFVGVDEENAVLGYCFCIVEDHAGSNNFVPMKTLYIDDLCVDEKMRGSGIGRKLFSFVKDYAGKEGFYNLTLNVWACNPPAISFYESLGLKPLKFGMETIL